MEEKGVRESVHLKRWEPIKRTVVLRVRSHGFVPIGVAPMFVAYCCSRMVAGCGAACARCVGQ